MSRTSILILTVYVMVIVSLASGLFAVRSRVLENRDAEASRHDWEQWRRAASLQAEGQGPVARRTPAATDAPTVLLLRDHFVACLTLTLVISTVLYATLAIMIRGVILGPKLQVHRDQTQRRNA